MVKNYKELEKIVRRRIVETGPFRLIIASPHTADDLIAVFDALKTGLVMPTIVGNRDHILKLMDESEIELDKCTVINEVDEAEVAARCVSLAREDISGSILLKGQISTPILLKKILDKKKGLRKNGILSDLFIYENPFRDQERQMLCITDGGVTVSPDLEQKKMILENAVRSYRLMGQPEPHVAVLSANEKVTLKMMSTVHARQLAELSAAKAFGPCVVEGPLGMDNALMKWCADQKGIQSEVAGNFDIMLLPNIETANITAKAIMLYLRPNLGHVLVGAKIPVLINSRIEKAPDRYHSILLAIHLVLNQGSIK